MNSSSSTHSTCQKCNEIKSNDSFLLKNGEWSKNCQHCRNYSQQIDQKRRIKNFQFTNVNHIYKEYKNSASKRNHSFQLSKDEFITFLNKPCHYCGFKNMKYTGIDRISSKIGYQSDNCVPSCRICNHLKNQVDYEDFFHMIHHILQQHKLLPTTQLYPNLFHFSPNVSYSRYQYDAKRRNIPFYLSEDEFTMIGKQPCYYCKCISPYTFSGIDRIQSNLPYQFDNCLPCCKSCNILKNCFQWDPLLHHFYRIYDYQQNKNAEPSNPFYTLLLQDYNTKLCKPNMEQPTSCVTIIEPDFKKHPVNTLLLPKFVYYRKETDKRGDSYVIDRHPNIEKKSWSTSSAKSIPSIQKYIDLLNQLEKIGHPDHDNPSYQEHFTWKQEYLKNQPISSILCKMITTEKIPEVELENDSTKEEPITENSSPKIKKIGRTRTITDETIYQIREDLEKGKLSQMDLSKKYNIHRNMIKKIEMKLFVPLKEMEDTSQMEKKKPSFSQKDFETKEAFLQKVAETSSIQKRTISFDTILSIMNLKNSGKPSTHVKSLFYRLDGSPISSDIVKNIWSGRTKVYPHEFSSHSIMSFETYQSMLS